MSQEIKSIYTRLSEQDLFKPWLHLPFDGDFFDECLLFSDPKEWYRYPVQDDNLSNLLFLRWIGILRLPHRTKHRKHMNRHTDSIKNLTLQNLSVAWRLLPNFATWILADATRTCWFAPCAADSAHLICWSRSSSCNSAYKVTCCNQWTFPCLTCSSACFVREHRLFCPIFLRRVVCATLRRSWQLVSRWV